MPQWPGTPQPKYITQCLLNISKHLGTKRYLIWGRGLSSFSRSLTPISVDPSTINSIFQITLVASTPTEVFHPRKVFVFPNEVCHPLVASTTKTVAHHRVAMFHLPCTDILLVLTTMKNNGKVSPISSSNSTVYQLSACRYKFVECTLYCNLWYIAIFNS